MYPEKRGTILVLGGYGGKNVGDDAQLAGTIDDLKTSIPDATLVVLTPDLNQTAGIHNLGAVGYAPRVALFDYDLDWHRYVRFEQPQNRSWLLDQAAHVLAESEKFAAGERHSLTARQLSLVEQIRDARLIYYAGGGYLMGPTASRLWDGMTVCRIASMFRTPVVMSGQNVGVWSDEYDRKSANSGFSSVSLIGLRDATFSKDALAEIGVRGDHIMTTHDDALFISAAPQKTSKYILSKIGLEKGREFVSLSLHLASGASEIIATIRAKTDMPIVFVPTCPPDMKIQLDAYKQAVSDGVKDIYIVRKLHSHAEVKGIISEASVCVSSRHHPIIFALGKGVPCVSLNYSPYFNAKNFGAMALCGMEQFSVDVSNAEMTLTGLADFSGRLRDLLENRERLSVQILKSHTALKAAKSEFMKRTKQIWNASFCEPQVTSSRAPSLFGIRLPIKLPSRSR